MKSGLPDVESGKCRGQGVEWRVAQGGACFYLAVTLLTIMPQPASRLTLLLHHDPVVITGAGAVSAAGPDAEALWTAAAEKKSPACWMEIPLPAGGTKRRAGCAVAPFDWTGHAWSGMARRLDPGAQFALEAAHQAARQARLLAGVPDNTRLGVICGTSRGPKQKWEEAHALLRAGRRVKPTMAATMTLAAAAGALAQVLGARGPSWMVGAACASGAFAIAAAAEQIALGHADIMLAGGADEALNAIVFAGLEAAGVLAHGSDDAKSLCRPFCQDRTGLVPGKGAGMLVLESLSSAERRGVTPLAVLSGWGLGMDPEGLAGMTAKGAGLQRTMRAALSLAGLEPRDIGYINAHGTGTQTNDAAEAAAITAVFGPVTPPCSSSKSVTGHCLGATPALEAILCLEALRRRALPPAYPCNGIDSACASLSFSNGGEADGLRHTLSNSTAFWGFQASLLFSRRE